MKCADSDKIVFDYIGGNLDEEKVKAFESHLLVCSRCSRYLSFVKGTLSVIDEARVVEPDPLFAGRIYKKIDSTPAFILKHRRIINIAAAAAVVIFAVFTGMNLAKFSSAGYLSSGSAIESDILFADEMSIEPIEYYFLSDND